MTVCVLYDVQIVRLLCHVIFLIIYFPLCYVLSLTVRIEEIVDDEKPVNEDDSKKAKKQKTQSRVSDGNENSDRQIVLKAGTGNGAPLLESEDEDGFPISGNKTGCSNSEPRLEETADEIVGEKTQKSKEIDGVACGKKSKEKIDADREGNVTRLPDSKVVFVNYYS